jgi:hypothetical protein
MKILFKGLKKVSFTGTKKGMTQDQKSKVRDLLVSFGATEFHHGSCIGSDKEAGDIATILKIYIIVHPPINEKYKAECFGREIRTPKSYLVRDKDIVDEGDILLATPKGFGEELRSGTWSTIRYARKVKKPVIIIFPDGSLKQENDSSFVLFT